VTIRAAIVGLGSWGQTLVSSVQGRCPELKFTAACTRTPSKVEAFCRQHDLRVTTFDNVLADRNVDAVVLATPNSQHEEQIKLAARAGKHVFTEKPVALDRGGVKAAIRATREAGVVFGVGFKTSVFPRS
jgi:predicted dehydrogenase